MTFLIVLAANIDNVGGIATIQGFEGLVANILGALLGAGGVLLFIMLITGGFKYMTAGGDPKALEGAKQTITHALLGIVLIACAYLILRFINFFTGADVINFRIKL